MFSSRVIKRVDQSVWFASVRYRTRVVKKKQQKELVKLKRNPEDFIVEEVTKSFTYGPGKGPYSVYYLTKKSMETQHAIYAVADEFNLKRNDIHFGGLKDKHAVTRQFITIENGPKRDYTQQSMSVKYIGDSQRHFHSSDIQGNKFKVTLRNLSSCISN